MARIESDKLEGEAFKSSEETFCRFFHVENLHEEQLHALRAFFEGKDVYFSAGTGYGKSLVFQAIPLLHDRLVKQVICTSIGIIICPLISLMLDEVAYLQYLGINVASIYADQDPKILEDVENGTYSHVYASPESMLSVQRWRSMIQPPTFQEHCLLVSVNEAHCISQWGLSGTESDSFRNWYGNLGEIRSLLDNGSFVVCTATATLTTKRKIFDALCLSNVKTLLLT